MGWRVRRERPARVGDFRPADLYGEFQKSTAAHQIENPARTRIPQTAARAGTLLYMQGERPRPGAALGPGIG